MAVCTRNGCKKEFTEEENVEGSCRFHPGAPVFHEGLKSWSCCSDVNKPELEFEQFMKIQGCQTGRHTKAAPKPPKPTSGPAIASNVLVSSDAEGKEVFTTADLASSLPPTPKPSSTPAPLPPVVEEEDDLSVPIEPGTPCRRTGCKAVFISDEKSRVGESEEAVCTYHSSTPIFHEGSKGYLCCRRRVLEFDEFLKIEGCKTGRHLFSPEKTTQNKDVQVSCRIDHYQTPQTVCVSIFAKKANKEGSTIKFDENDIHLDLVLPDGKRFTRTLELFGPIHVDDSSYTIMSTKIELLLKKRDTRSWNVLERTDRSFPGYSLTFGVSGRTGTIGSKEPPMLAAENNIA